MKEKHCLSSAFSLVEVTLALGLATYCLVAVSGLLSVGFSSDQISNQQTLAANLVKAVVADLRATSVSAGTSSSSTSPLFGFQIPNAGHAHTVQSLQTVYFTEGANAAGAMGSAPVIDSTLSSAAKYRVSVAFTPPASADLRNSTSVRILVTWPALADQNPEAWPTLRAGSVEIVTALDRN